MKLLRRREIWIPTLWGWGLVLVAIGSSSLVLLFCIHPFLGSHDPIDTDILVVEGWMNKREIHQAKEEFGITAYRLVFTTGGPIPVGSYLRDLYPQFDTIAELSAETLRTSGIDRVTAVPTASVVRNRTYASAVALKEKLERNGMLPARFNLLSSGVHSRRSRLLFQLAFEEMAQIGILSLPTMAYDPDRWWTSSAGVRRVIGEAIAYIYANFLFFPTD